MIIYTTLHSAQVFISLYKVDNCFVGAGGCLIRVTSIQVLLYATGIQHNEAHSLHMCMAVLCDNIHVA